MDRQHLEEKLTIFSFFKLKEKMTFLFTNYYRENMNLHSLENPNIRVTLIWPLGVLHVCLAAGEYTALFQLQPNTEIIISTAFNGFQSNPQLSIREGH